MAATRAALPLVERKALLEPIMADIPSVQFRVIEEVVGSIPSGSTNNIKNLSRSA
jgi:hypothetical protein